MAGNRPSTGAHDNEVGALSKTSRLGIRCKTSLRRAHEFKRDEEPPKIIQLPIALGLSRNLLLFPPHSQDAHKETGKDCLDSERKEDGCWNYDTHGPRVIQHSEVSAAPG